MDKKKSAKLFSVIFTALIIALLVTLKFKKIKRIYTDMGLRFSENQKQEIKQKLAKLFFFNIHGKIPGKAAKKFIRKYKPGGIIIMSSNIKDITTLKQFINQIRNIYSDKNEQALPLTPLFAIDQEGGRVRRIKKGIMQFPSAKEMAKKGAEFVKNASMQTNNALFKTGINVNFSPVADVLINKNNKVIGDRAFSDNEDVVSKMVESYLKGAKKTGIITCVKHFPGHGNVKTDSHKSLPTDNSEINELNIKPFKTAINNGVHMIMIAHILYPKIDSVPATFSKNLISALRVKYKFHGVIISDDLSMGAIKKRYKKSKVVLNALKAGGDMFIHTAIKYSDHIKLLNETTELLVKDIKALVALERALKNVENLKSEVRKNFY